MFFAGFLATLVAINSIGSSSDITASKSTELEKLFLTRFPEDITNRDIKITKADGLNTYPETKSADNNDQTITLSNNKKEPENKVPIESSPNLSGSSSVMPSSTNSIIPEVTNKVLFHSGSTPSIPSAVHDNTFSNDRKVTSLTPGDDNPLTFNVNKSRFNHDICDFCIYEGEGNFTSYGYPLPYRANLNCSYRIQRVDSDICELEMIFHDFDVPVSSLNGPSVNSESHECFEDYLQVSGIKYCGFGWKGKSTTVQFPLDMKEITFYFISNERVSGRGFWIEIKKKLSLCYDKKPISVCEEGFNEENFMIISPGYPNFYPSNGDCSYHIRKSSNNVCGLEMKFLHFDLESSDECLYDYLSIDGEKLCGTIGPNSIKQYSFEENEKILIFHSDKRVSRTGFHIFIRQLTNCLADSLPPPPSCNVCTNERSGQLVSYSYPRAYRNNLLCRYILEKAGSQFCSIELYFEDFDIAPTLDCTGDYLMIDGQSYCGTTLHSNKLTLSFTTNNSIEMIFKTDSQSTGKGFNIKYEQTLCDKSKCDHIFTEKTFMLTNGKTAGYEDSMDCTYLVKKNRSNVCYLELTFVKFDIEASPQCQYDYLEINSVRLCGTLRRETSRTYIFDKEEKLIKFHSDGSNHREGFVIRAEQLECVDGVIIRNTTDIKNPDIIRGTTDGSKKPVSPSTGISPFSVPNPLIPQPTGSTITPSPYPSTRGQNGGVQYPETNELYPTGPVICDRIYTEQFFYITSPSYPGQYPSDKDCIFMIQKINPSICRLEVTYKSFDLQQADDDGYCKFDFLDFNGIRMCGTVNSDSVRNYYFPESTFAIRFHSDEILNAGGFWLKVKQSECDPNALMPSKSPSNKQHDTECDAIYSEGFFSLVSPNYPNNYPGGIGCVYTVMKKSPVVCQLEVHVIFFELDDTPGCVSEGLDFDGKVLCGSLHSKSLKYFPFERQEIIIQFRSDDRDSGDPRGFFLQIRQRECPDGFSVNESKKPGVPSVQEPEQREEHCGQIISNLKFEFKSPLYPQVYENEIDCVYIIKKMHERICSIELKFVDFDLKNEINCIYDYMMIGGRKKICGSLPSGTIRQYMFEGHEIRIIFHSDRATQTRGFFIKGIQRQCDNESIYPSHPSLPSYPSEIDSSHSLCELCFALPEGDIKSIGYPKGYIAGLNCNYRITGYLEKCAVYLRFDEFELEESKNGVCEDFLQIEGTKYCGTSLKGSQKLLDFTGNPKEAILQFVSKNNSHRKGFKISYAQISCNNIAISSSLVSGEQMPSVVTGPGAISVMDPLPNQENNETRIPCDLMIYDLNFEISSPGYPYSYPVNSDCLYSIRKGPSICKIRIQLIDFDIEESGNCEKDYLEIDNKKICGPLPKDNIIEIGFHDYKMGIRFKSDHSDGGKGFMIRGTQVECPNSKENGFSETNLSRAPIPSVSASHEYPTNYHKPNTFSTSLPPSPVSHRTKYPSHILSLDTFLPKCDETITQEFFNIKSPDYPYRYPPGSKCAIVIKKSNKNVCQLDLMFVGFDLSKEPCLDDFISIGGERICGTITPGKVKTYRFDHPEKFIFFRGDSGNGLGYHIRGRQVRCELNSDFNLFGSGSYSGIYQQQNSQNSNYLAQTSFPGTYSYTNQPNYRTISGSYSTSNSISPLSSLDSRIHPSSNEFSISSDFANNANNDRTAYSLSNAPYSRSYQDHSNLRRDYSSNSNINPSSYRFSRSKSISRSLGRSFSGSSNIPYCDQIFASNEISLKSPNFPNDYPSNLYCRYVIKRPSNSHCALDMIFINFDLETSEGCIKDYLEIDGSRICGRFIPNYQRRYNYLNGENQKTVVFRSDSTIGKSGFNLMIKQVTSCSFDENSPIKSQCNECMKETVGQITSDGYPRNYPDNANCNFRIQAAGPNYCKVKIYIRDLDIEPSEGCKKDYLYIQENRLCTSNYKTGEMTLFFPEFGLREVVLSFYSDNATNKRGFFLDYMQEICPSPTSKSLPSSPFDTPNYPSDYVSRAKSELSLKIDGDKKEFSKDEINFEEFVKTGDSIYVSELSKVSKS